MKKTMLITGSTDGIGKLTAKILIEQGHHVLLHGRDERKLTIVKDELSQGHSIANVDTYAADLSDLNQVIHLAERIQKNHPQLDVLINNAGVYKVHNKTTADGLDVRFVINTVAPYLLTRKLKGIMSQGNRVINLSSAAQAPIDPLILNSTHRLSDDLIYAQSKLALTMWSRHMAQTQSNHQPDIIAVNPASLLGSNMVKDAYGIEGKDLQIGADILVKAALSEEFANASGRYFDNDKGRFSDPHADALDVVKCRAVTQKLEEMIADYL